jgi:hypothetical protein
MAIILSGDDMDSILDHPSEHTHEAPDDDDDEIFWDWNYCGWCGEALNDTRLLRRHHWYHEACLAHMEAAGGIDE